MSKRTITVLDRQSIWDIAIREYGSVEAVFALLLDNPELSGVDAPLVAGQQLVIRSADVDSDVVRYYRENALWPVTGELVDFEPVPEPEDPPGSVRLVINDNYAGDAEWALTTTTNYVRWRKPGGATEVLFDSAMYQTGLEVGTHVLTPVDGDDEPTGTITSLQLYLMEVGSLSGSGCSFIPEVVLSFIVLPNAFAFPAFAAGALVYIDELMTGASISMAAMNAVGNLYISQSEPGLESITWPTSMPNCTSLQLVNTALALFSVDAGINALSALNPNGSCFIVGGTAASPGPDSADRRDELDNAGWDQGYN
jgi:hypothetical protein